MTWTPVALGAVLGVFGTLWAIVLFHVLRTWWYRRQLAKILNEPRRPWGVR